MLGTPFDMLNVERVFAASLSTFAFDCGERWGQAIPRLRSGLLFPRSDLGGDSNCFEFSVH